MRNLYLFSFDLMFVADVMVQGEQALDYRWKWFGWGGCQCYMDSISSNSGVIGCLQNVWLIIWISYLSIIHGIIYSSLLDMSTISLETSYIFSWFNVIFNPAIFFTIFNFTLITHHNIMACNLELHAITMLFCHASTTHVAFSLMTSLQLLDLKGLGLLFNHKST